jgi:hypothetical protein
MPDFEAKWKNWLVILPIWWWRFSGITWQQKSKYALISSELADSLSHV